MQTIEIWLPITPLTFSVLIGVFIAYLVYSGVKFVVSLWTGAS